MGLLGSRRELLDKRFRIPFDLKLSKLTGRFWNRRNLKSLATQLLENQGEPRSSIENRITVLFDGSKDSSVDFFKRNEDIIIRKVVEAISDTRLWHKVFGTYQCVILIKPSEYKGGVVYREHPIGEGLREKDKAKYHSELVRRIAKLSNGLVEANPEEEEHGVDGWVWLPISLLPKRCYKQKKQISTEITEKVKKGFLLTSYELVRADDVEIQGDWVILKDAVILGLRNRKIAYVHETPRFCLQKSLLQKVR